MTPAATEYVLRQASCRASVLVTTAGFSRDKWADLRQEFVLDYLRRARHFDAERGEWRKFVAGVMRNHSAVLFRRLKRRERWELLESELLNDDEGRGDDSGDLLASPRTDSHNGELELRVDVARVLRRLPTQLQVLAQLLSVISIGEIPTAMGRSRSRIYQMLRQVRLAFIDAGLASTVDQAR